MSYITSRNYKRLAKLMDDGENVIVIIGERSYFASKDRYKGYYVGDSWLEHDIEFSIFASKDKDELIEFCQKENAEFIDSVFMREMYEALKKITGMEPGEYEEEFSSMRDITVSCYRCEEMQDIALEALKKETGEK